MNLIIIIFTLNLEEEFCSSMYSFESNSKTWSIDFIVKSYASFP